MQRSKDQLLLRQSESDLLLFDSENMLLRRAENHLLLCGKEMLLWRAGSQGEDGVRLRQDVRLLLVR